MRGESERGMQQWTSFTAFPSGRMKERSEDEEPAESPIQLERGKVTVTMAYAVNNRTGEIVTVQLENGKFPQGFSRYQSRK